MSFEKKIMFKNWSRPLGFPRERIARYLDDSFMEAFAISGSLENYGNKRISLKKKKGCRRKHGAPHEFMLTVFPHHKDWNNWKDYVCRNCGKQEYILSYPENPGWSSKKKLNIVG